MKVYDSRRLFLIVLLFTVGSACATLNGTVHMFRTGHNPGERVEDGASPSEKLYGPWFNYEDSGPDVVRQGENYTIFFDNAFFKYLPDLNDQNEVLIVFTFQEGGSAGEDDRLVKIVGPMNRIADGSLSAEISKISYGPKPLNGDSLIIKIQIVEFDAQERENRGAFLDFVGQAAETFNLADPVTAQEIKLAKEIARTINDFDQNDEVLTFTFELVPHDVRVAHNDMGLPLRTGHYGLIKADRKALLGRYMAFSRENYAASDGGWWLLGALPALVGDVVLLIPAAGYNAYFDQPDGLAVHPIKINEQSRVDNPLERDDQRVQLAHRSEKLKIDIDSLSASQSRSNAGEDAAIIQLKIQELKNRFLRDISVIETGVIRDYLTEKEYNLNNNDNIITHCEKKLTSPNLNATNVNADEHLIHALCLTFMNRERPVPFRHRYFGLTRRAFGSVYQSQYDGDGYIVPATLAALFAIPFDVILTPFVFTGNLASDQERFYDYGTEGRIHPTDPHLRDKNPELIFPGDDVPILYENNTRTLVMGGELYTNKTWLTFSIEKGRDAGRWHIRSRLSQTEKDIIDMLHARSTAEILDEHRNGLESAISSLRLAREQARRQEEADDRGFYLARPNNLFEIKNGDVESIQIPVHHSAKDQNAFSAQITDLNGGESHELSIENKSPELSILRVLPSELNRSGTYEIRIFPENPLESVENTRKLQDQIAALAKNPAFLALTNEQRDSILTQLRAQVPRMQPQRVERIYIRVRRSTAVSGDRAIQLSDLLYYDALATNKLSVEVGHASADRVAVSITKIGEVSKSIQLVEHERNSETGVTRFRLPDDDEGMNAMRKCFNGANDNWQPKCEIVFTVNKLGQPDSQTFHRTVTDVWAPQNKTVYIQPGQGLELPLMDVTGRSAVGVSAELRSGFVSGKCSSGNTIAKWSGNDRYMLEPNAAQSIGTTNDSKKYALVLSSGTKCEQYSLNMRRLHHNVIAFNGNKIINPFAVNGNGNQPGNGSSETNVRLIDNDKHVFSVADEFSVSNGSNRSLSIGPYTLHWKYNNADFEAPVYLFDAAKYTFIDSYASAQVGADFENSYGHIQKGHGLLLRSAGTFSKVQYDSGASVSSSHIESNLPGTSVYKIPAEEGPDRWVSDDTAIKIELDRVEDGVMLLKKN
ncbi:MAG: hypothetical protein KDK30_00915 [Leptospiraceae bacterium]|nr:hypothetical protein [Leptospiraceae bacterium]